MTSKWMASVATIALLAPMGARAQSADIPALQAQTEALKAQNLELEQRLDKLEQRQAAVARPAPASSDFLAQVTKGPLQAVADDGPICWKGVCIFGAVDAGVGWVSHGLPENGKNYEGESLLTKFANRPYFGIAQNSLSAVHHRREGRDGTASRRLRRVHGFDRLQPAIGPARQHARHDGRQSGPQPQHLFLRAATAAAAAKPSTISSMPVCPPRISAS